MDEIRALLRRYAIIAWRKRWFAIGLAWLVCIGGWIGVASIPNQYEASARLYVDADAVLTPLLRGLALDNTPASQVETLQRTLLSRPNLEKLISKTDLELQVTGDASKQELVQKLAADIKVMPQTRNLFTLSYRNTSPKLAYDVVQSILSIFIESKVGSSRTDMENARQFLQQQITSYEHKLREAEAKRADFRSKYVDLLPDNAGGAPRLDTARAQVESLKGQVQDLIAKRDALKHELATTPPTLEGDAIPNLAPRAVGGPNELQRAEAALAELRLRYTEQHPDVIAARIRVAALRANPPPGPEQEAQLRGHAIPNPVYQQMKTQLFDAEISLAAEQRQLTAATKERDRLEEVARNVPGVQAEFANLDRDYDVMHKNFLELLNRREAMQLSAAADVDADKVKLEIIDPPQVPQLPVAPKRLLLVSAVLAAGIGAGIGLSFLLQQLDKSFHSLDDLRQLGLPVVGGISLVRAAIPMKRRLIAASSFAVAVLLLCMVYGGLMWRLLNTPGVA
jgi:polysaccharide chain length determinant protein (PEP-CTERM system associated)